MSTSTTTTASWASVLHRMAMGEDVPGAELLRLPGIDRAPPSLRGQLCAALDYCASDLPELFEFAGAMAGGEAKHAADVMAAELFEHAPTGPLPPVVQLAAWGIGIEADFAAICSTERH